MDKYTEKQIYFTCKQMGIIYGLPIEEWQQKFKEESEIPGGNPELLMDAWRTEIDQKIDDLMWRVQNEQ